jgi:hypothetical protein
MNPLDLSEFHNLTHAQALSVVDFATMLPTISVTGATTATPGGLHLCSGTTADYTLTLPSASSYKGRLIGVLMDSGLTKLVTVNGVPLWSGEGGFMYSDGANWIWLHKLRKPMQATMYLSANQGSIATGSLTAILLDTANLDNSGLMADATNKRVNILRTSNYFCSGVVRWSNLTTTAPRLVTAIQNSAASISVAAEGYGVSGSFTGTPVPVTIPLTAGDWLKLFGFQNSGVDQAVFGSANFGQGQCFMSVLEQPTW